MHNGRFWRWRDSLSRVLERGARGPLRVLVERDVYARIALRLSYSSKPSTYRESVVALFFWYSMTCPLSVASGTAVVPG